MDEETLRTIACVIDADNDIRNSVINNLGSSGERGLEEISYEIAQRLSNRYDINLGAELIASALSKPFEWGMERYMADYDRKPLEQDSLVSRDGNVDQNSVDHAMGRIRHVNVMIEALDCRGNNENYYWQDFAGRGYNAIRDKIANEYGESAVKKFDYYEWGPVRDDLNSGIRMTLNRAYSTSNGSVQYLHYATRRLEEIVDVNRQSQQSELSANASLFR